MEEKQIYRWMTHGRRNCERCDELAGREMCFADWLSSVLPGMHVGCDCSLEPVDEVRTHKREDTTRLIPSPPTHNTLRLSLDKRVTYSHTALKPLVHKVQAVLPHSRSRPQNILHYGG
jgi:hypothetical protein